jgi:hypothetical protein
MNLRILIITIFFSSSLFRQTNPNRDGQTRDNVKMIVDVKDSALYNKLQQMDFNKYIGSVTVGNFLKDIGLNYKDSTLGFAPPSYLRYILFAYSDKLWIELQVNEFRHMSSWNPEHKWDTENFKKEKIGAIRFKYEGKCIKCIGTKSK